MATSLGPQGRCRRLWQCHGREEEKNEREMKQRAEQLRRQAGPKKGSKMDPERVPKMSRKRIKTWPRHQDPKAAKNSDILFQKGGQSRGR